MTRTLCLIASAAILAFGCQTPDGRTDRTATGALTGGAIGAGTGAIIGNYAGHNTAGGAAIGGAIGLLTGGIIGNAMDQQQRETLERQSPQTMQRFEQGQPQRLAGSGGHGWQSCLRGPRRAAGHNGDADRKQPNPRMNDLAQCR